MLVGQWQQILKLTFRAVALYQNQGKNDEFCVVRVVRKGSTPFVRTWLREEKEAIKSMYNSIRERNLNRGV